MAGVFALALENARIFEKNQKSEKDLRAVNAELKEALDKVKVLTGMLPVCSYCKNIRDDKGQWQKMEYYLHERTEASFTHGICPSCMTRLFPDARRQGGG